MSSTRTIATNFWIFPFQGNDEPSVKQIPDLQEYSGVDEIVISEPMLATFKEKAHPRKAEFNFNDLRRCHQATVANIKIKDMQSPLGEGAFAAEQGMRAGRKFIYTGVYDMAATYHNTSLTQQTYLMPLAEPFADVVVNANHIVNKARYLQHLPALKEADFFTFIKLEVAMQNVTYEVKYFSVMIEQQKYIIPFTLLSNILPLQPNSILGYTYPAPYWRAEALLPSIFDNSGAFASGLFIELYGPTPDHHIQFHLNSKGATFLQNNRYIHLDDYLYILPAEVTQLAANNTNAVVLPYILQLHCRGKQDYIASVDDEPLIAFPFNADRNKQHWMAITAFKKTNSCRVAIVKHAEQGDKLVVYIKDITKLNFKEASIFFQLLNEVSPSYLDFTAGANVVRPTKYIHGKHDLFARRAFLDGPDKGPASSSSSRVISGRRR